MAKRPGVVGVAAVVVLVGLLAGCGSDGDDPEGSPASTTVVEGAGQLATLLDEVDPPAEPGSGTTIPTTSSVPVPSGGDDSSSQGYAHTASALNALGDDPLLDAKALDCFHGDLTACDDLYVGSPNGSLYEAYGATCGARVDEPTNRLCVDVLLPSADDPTGLGDDEFLDALAAQCYAGDVFDCDLLYAEADTGSQYEAYGASCGRRIEATDEDCVDALL